MNLNYFHAFERAKSLGKKAEAKTNLTLFIESFCGVEAETRWIKEYLESGDYGHKIRHELYAEVIFPYLLDLYKQQNPWATFWLAKTASSYKDNNQLLSQMAYKTDLLLYRECIEYEPDNEHARQVVLEDIVLQLRFAIHEMDFGVIYTPFGTPHQMLEEIEYARSLDNECRYTLLFDEVKEIVLNDIQRSS